MENANNQNNEKNEKKPATCRVSIAKGEEKEKVGVNVWGQQTLTSHEVKNKNKKMKKKWIYEWRKAEKQQLLSRHSNRKKDERSYPKKLEQLAIKKSNIPGLVNGLQVIITNCK